MKRKQLIWISVFWGICLVWFLLFKEYTNFFGTEIFLKSAPIDPNDVFRWDYVRLGYDISSIPCPGEYGSTIYIPLTIWVNNLAIGGVCSTSKPTNTLFIKWTKKSSSRNIFGIEQYFVQEGKGKELEDMRSSMLIKLKVDNFGRALIKWFKFE